MIDSPCCIYVSFDEYVFRVFTIRLKKCKKTSAPSSPDFLY